MVDVIYAHNIFWRKGTKPILQVTVQYVPESIFTSNWISMLATLTSLQVYILRQQSSNAVMTNSRTTSLKQLVIPARPSAMTKKQLTETTLVWLGTVAQQTLKGLQRGSQNWSRL
jgi:hypothetical protein